MKQPRAVSCAVLAGLLLLQAGCGNKGPRELTEQDIRTQRLTFYLIADGSFIEPRPPFHIMSKSHTNGLLFIFGTPHTSRDEIAFSEEQIRELREALVRERYFDLARRYGDKGPETPYREMQISIAGKIRKVALWPLPEDGLPPEELEEYKRALRVWRVVRDWYNDQYMVDFREGDNEILNM